ncbi:MAG: hypothetical protein D6723_15815, partial [Acidobacteria bacterium]
LWRFSKEPFMARAEPHRGDEKSLLEDPGVLRVFAVIFEGGKIWAHLWNLWRFSKEPFMARAEPHRGDEKSLLEDLGVLRVFVAIFEGGHERCRSARLTG